jgi:hypothetical protein
MLFAIRVIAFLLDLTFVKALLATGFPRLGPRQSAPDAFPGILAVMIHFS